MWKCLTETRLQEKEIKDWRLQLNPQGKRVVVFLGSFRPWHGVRGFFLAAQEILKSRDDILFLMIGAGELLEETRSRVVGANLQDRSHFRNRSRWYVCVPYYLAVGDVGVAPFNTQVHPPLRVGFYCRPSKYTNIWR